MVIMWANQASRKEEHKGIVKVTKLTWQLTLLSNTKSLRETSMKRWWLLPIILSLSPPRWTLTNLKLTVTASTFHFTRYQAAPSFCKQSSKNLKWGDRTIKKWKGWTKTIWTIWITWWFAISSSGRKTTKGEMKRTSLKKTKLKCHFSSITKEKRLTHSGPLPPI